MIDFIISTRTVMDLSDLKEVGLREIWKHEALDFSQWMIKENNLSLLSKTINLSLSDPQTEQNAGDFKIDIVCKDDNGNNVIIENQLEQTDHSHLGQIIAYASAMKAQAVIWVAKTVRDEHIEAINWLNEITDDKYNFFLIEIKVYQIDNSRPAPKFNVIVQPNNWSKNIRTRSSGALDEFSLEKQKFWQEFVEYAANQDYLDLKSLDVPRLNYWLTVLKISTAYLALNINKKGIVIRLYPIERELFDELINYRQEIDQQFKLATDWRTFPKTGSIRAEVSGSILDTKTRGKLIKSLYDTTKQFMEVFPKYLK